MLYSKFISCNCDFSKFWCGLGKEFIWNLRANLKLLYLFKMFISVRQGFSSIMTVKDNVVDPTGQGSTHILGM